jgi:gliding motility-associated-like protein
MKNITFILWFICIQLTAQQITIVSDTVCQGVPTSLSASINIDEGLIDAYLWDLDFDGYYDDAEGKATQFTFSGTGTILIKLQVDLREGGSYTSDDYQVVVRPIPVADFFASNLCLGDPVTLKNTSTIENSDSLLYAWDFDNNGTTDSEEKDEILTLEGSNQSITMHVTSSGGCTDVCAKEIILHEKPVSDFQCESACKFETVDFINLSTSSGDSILYSVWNFGDSNLSVSKNTEHAYLSAGFFSVTLVSITRNNCRDSVTQELEIYELPEITILAEDTVFFPKDELTLSARSNSADILWSTGSNAPEISVNSEGYYTVMATDVNNCVNADTIRIFSLAINEKVIKSEILTPNGDGFNDVLEIKELFKDYHCELSVFNEWGQQVYVSSDYQNDWDCTNNGRTLDAGAYYYQIRLNDRNFRGCVNILR